MSKRNVKARLDEKYYTSLLYIAEPRNIGKHNDTS